jgi:ABC-type transporter Mla subunit MlaD
MTEKPNFFKLGVFLLIAAGLIVGGIILFGSGAFAKKKTYFETYFAEPVKGLDSGSPVLLSGVKIGEVENVTFVRKSYELPLDDEGISKYDQYVHVNCSAIEENLPISEMEGREKRLVSFVERGMRLRLASNLITGQAYLEAMTLDPERFPAMEVPWQPKYAYIPSAPSAFRTMQDSVDQILQKIEQIEFKTVVDNLNKVLTNLNQAILDTNMKALSADMQKLVGDVDQAVSDANVKELSAKIQQLVGDADLAVNNADIKGLSTKASAFIDELRESNSDLKKLLENPDSKKELANIAVLVDKFNQVLDDLDNLIVSEKPELREIIEHIRHLSENLDYLSEHLKDNPSELIFSSPPPKIGEMK